MDVLLQGRRDGKAAKRFFRRLLAQGEPRKIVTDKLGSYRVAQRDVLPDGMHDRSRYANNRAERSHERTRFRERGMRRFKSPSQAQQFLEAHSAVSNLFNLGRHLMAARHYRDLRTGAFEAWDEATA
jgi:putative transposase